MQVLVAVDGAGRGAVAGGALDGELVMPRPEVFVDGPPFVGLASLRPAVRAERVELDGVTLDLLSVAVADALHRLGLLSEVWTEEDETLVDRQVARMLGLVAV